MKIENVDDNLISDYLEGKSKIRELNLLSNVKIECHSDK
jgi:hypothetical protein